MASLTAAQFEAKYMIAPEIPSHVRALLDGLKRALPVAPVTVKDDAGTFARYGRGVVVQSRRMIQETITTIENYIRQKSDFVALYTWFFRTPMSDALNATFNPFFVNGAYRFRAFEDALQAVYSKAVPALAEIEKGKGDMARENTAGVGLVVGLVPVLIAAGFLGLCGVLGVYFWDRAEVARFDMLKGVQDFDLETAREARRMKEKGFSDVQIDAFLKAREKSAPSKSLTPDDVNARTRGFFDNLTAGVGGSFTTLALIAAAAFIAWKMLGKKRA
jgi:hypothetical protein